MDQPFEVVLFNNGTLPNDPQNAEPPQAPLPLLTNVLAIRGLSPAHAARYLAGYGVPNIQGVAEWRKAIGHVIGCTVEI